MSCSGILGKIFGHNIRSVFNRETVGIDSLEIVREILVSSYPARMQCGELADILEAMTDSKSFYVHSVCKRCGYTVK